MWYVILIVIIVILVICLCTKEATVVQKVIKNDVPQKVCLSKEITKKLLDLTEEIHRDITKDIVDLNHINIIRQLVVNWLEPYSYWKTKQFTHFLYVKNYYHSSHDEFFLKHYKEACDIFANYFNASYTTTGLHTVIEFTEEIDGDGGNPYESQQIHVVFDNMSLSKWLPQLHYINTKIIENK